MAEIAELQLYLRLIFNSESEIDGNLSIKRFEGPSIIKFVEQLLPQPVYGRSFPIQRWISFTLRSDLLMQHKYPCTALFIDRSLWSCSYLIKYQHYNTTKWVKIFVSVCWFVFYNTLEFTFDFSESINRACWSSVQMEKIICTLTLIEISLRRMMIVGPWADNRRLHQIQLGTKNFS